ncbi:class I SAM-dependent methyltransferase [Candidatus Parcubacteria bacterium]|nr:class I SAM-dependent methyltransferase [Candidatus Parcubacteria bacterium]
MFKKITRKNLERFLQRHATTKRTLDVGSGGSAYSKYFPDRLTMDLDPTRKPEVVADAHDLPFKDEEFEVILCTEVLEHVKNPFKVESELRRVAKRGGQLILSTRFVFPLHDTPHDYWRYTKYGLRELFKEWEIVEIVEETENFSAIGALLQRLAFQSELRFNKLSKLVLFLLAFILDHLNGLTLREYGDIKHVGRDKNIMTTGYYIVCKKK